MSDKPISVGDLVVCLWAPNKEAQKFQGAVRTVLELSPHCLGHWRLTPPTVGSHGRLIAWHPRRLKRIPPLSELEGEKRDEESTA